MTNFHFQTALCVLVVALLVGAHSVIKPTAAAPTHVVALSGQHSGGELPGQSDAFVNSIGVDSAFSYRGSTYTREWPTISAALIASGIKHIRDGGAPTPAYDQRMATLGAHGIRHAAAFNVGATPQYITSTLTTFAPYIDFVEPQNEYDSFAARSDPDWTSKIIAEQRTLYTTVHGNPAFSGITVLGPALAHQQLYAALGGLDQYEDAGNLHYASCDDNPGLGIPGRGLLKLHAMIRASTQTKPIWTTEMGYNDHSPRLCEVPDDVIAKYDPRTSAERWNQGEPRSYFFQLADMPYDPVFGHMGLLHADGSPKPQFTALTSLIHVLTDAGPSFTPTPLQYAMSSDTQNVDHTLLQKRDGRYELLLWLEVPSWKSDNHVNGTGRRINVPLQNIALTVPSSITSAKVFRYGPDWKMTSTDVRISGGSVHLNVSDTIAVLELKPKG